MMQHELVSEDENQVTIRVFYALWETKVTLNKKTKVLTTGNNQPYSIQELQGISLPASWFLKTFL